MKTTQGKLKKTIVACLERGKGCIVDPTAEVHVQVYEGELTRRFDEGTNLWLLDL